MITLRKLLATLLLTLLLVACSPNPVERTIERLDALVVLLEDHKDDPDAMLEELERFVEAHQGEWQEDRARIEALDEEAQGRLEARYERDLTRVLGQLYDVSQEILVDLEHDPQRRARFIELLGRIQ